MRDLKQTCAIMCKNCAIEDRAAKKDIFDGKPAYRERSQLDCGHCGSKRRRRLRRIAVGIEKSAFHPLEVPQLIEECFNQLLATAQAIHDPFEQSFFAMVHLPYLQPFDDVNKRVSRLAANIPFIKANLSPLAFTDVPRSTYTNAILGVYELNKVDLLKDVFI